MPATPYTPHDNAQHSAAYSGYSKLDEHRTRDERTHLLRSLLLGALTVTAVLYGLGVYFGLSNAQRSYAGKEFKSLASQVGQDVRKSFTKSVQTLNYLAERYASTFPDEAEWPTVYLPGYVNDIPYLRDSSNLDMLLFTPIVKFEDISRTEVFLMDAWATDPLVPFGAGLYPIAGIYGVNESAGGAIYKDTRRVDWPAQYEVVLPMAQMLFDTPIPPFFLGRDFHSVVRLGSVAEESIQCADTHNYSFARESCGRGTRLQPVDPLNLHSEVTVISNLVAPIMLKRNSSQLVGIVGGQFNWGKVISALIPDHVSGIDIVLRTQGDAVTYSVQGGQAHFQSLGDTHGDRYTEFKYVETGVVISGTDTCTIEFYPQQQFIDVRTDNTPVYLSVGTGLFILLCTLLFFLYDVPMRNSAIRTEIVLETKRRFVRFISHEIRTPLNTVNMGLTVFGQELDCIHDTVVQMVGGQGQSGAQPSALEVVQKCLLGKIEELKSIAREVTASTEEAVVVLNDLLNYDKIESGIFVLEFAFVAVGEVLQRSMATLLLQARDKNVSLTLRTIEDEAQETDEGRATEAGADTGAGSAERMESGLGALELDPRYQLVGDESRLGQVLRNLLSNALKFTNAGGTVSVTVQRVPGGMPEQVRIALPEEQSSLLTYPRAGSVRISVVDSGAGLSEQQVLDIGQEGLQFNVSTLQGGGGSGLGLFITKGLVLQHGGQITVTSPGLGRGVSTMLEFPVFDVVDSDHLVTVSHSQELGARGGADGGGLGVGGGTVAQLGGIQLSPVGAYALDPPAQHTFGLITPSLSNFDALSTRPTSTTASGSAYPASPSASAPAPGTVPATASVPATATASTTATASASVGAVRHMLVVDDAVSNRKMLLRIFRLKGFICEEACDGQQAIESYQQMCADQRPPEAVLMDYEMPVMNGPTATKQLREMGCGSYIVGVTGNVMKEDKDFFISCGADDVLPKPVNAASVERLLAFLSSPREEGSGKRLTP